MITIQTSVNWFGLRFEQKQGITWFFLTVDAAQCHSVGHTTQSTASVRMIYETGSNCQPREHGEFS